MDLAIQKKLTVEVRIKTNHVGGGCIGPKYATKAVGVMLKVLLFFPNFPRSALL